MLASGFPPALKRPAATDYLRLLPAPVNLMQLVELNGAHSTPQSTLTLTNATSSIAVEPDGRQCYVSRERG